MAKLVFAILPTKGGKLRDEYIAKLADTSVYSKENEPGVLTYTVGVPRDDDQKTVYMIEVYSDKAALDSHMQTDKVKDMIQWMGANPVLEGAPTVLELDVVEGLGPFTRLEAIDKVADPYLVVGEVPFKSAELLEKSFPYWKKVVETTSQDEPGSLVYAITRGANEPNKLYSLEGYESKDYLWDVHAKSAAVQNNVATTKDWRDGAVKHHFVKKIHGYLAKAKI